MDSVHNSDTDGGDAFCVRIENDFWQPPGWKEDRERPNTCLRGTGSEQPRPPGVPPELRPAHSSVYICLFREVIIISLCSLVLPLRELPGTFPHEPKCTTSTSLWL